MQKSKLEQLNYKREEKKRFVNRQLEDSILQAEESFTKNIEEIKRKEEESKKREKEWSEQEYKRYNE